MTVVRRPPLSGEARQLAERLLIQHTVRATAAALCTAGFDASYSQVDSVRRSMSGKSTAPRERTHGGGGFLPAHVEPIAEAPAVRGARDGSMMLLRRQLETGKHSIVCKVRFAEACRLAGL